MGEVVQFPGKGRKEDGDRNFFTEADLISIDPAFERAHKRVLRSYDVLSMTVGPDIVSVIARVAEHTALTDAFLAFTLGLSALAIGETKAALQERAMLREHD